MKEVNGDDLQEIIERFRDDDFHEVLDLEPVFEYVERGLADLVVLEGAEIRGVILGGSKVSSELRLKKGDAVFAVLVPEEVAKRLGTFVGDRVTLLFRLE